MKPAVTVKVINKVRIGSATESYRDGATVSEKVFAYDAISGTPVLTERNDEFGNRNVSYNQPAYWKYTNMGAAYTNIGYKFKVDPATMTSAGNTAYPWIIDLDLPGTNADLHHGDEVIPATDEEEAKMVH